MKLYIKYDGIVACRVILQEQLERLNIKYTPVTRAWWNRINDGVPADVFAELQSSLVLYFIVNNEKSQLIQRIKDTIVEMIYENEKLPSVTISQYLSDKLNFSYGYITNIFTENTYSSVRILS
jgi:hypothetical protein